MVEDNLLYSKSTNLDANFIGNTLPDAFIITCDQISGHHGPAKLTHMG
jgi:hypothetical protein